MVELQQMEFKLDPAAPLEWSMLVGILIFGLLGNLYYRKLKDWLLSFFSDI